MNQCSELNNEGIQGPTLTKEPINFSQIILHDPELRTQHLQSYHVYKITSIPFSMDGVYRRYSDFKLLYEALMILFPGVMIPSLPPKKLFGSTNETFVFKLRKPGLEHFLNYIQQIPILCESIPFQMFITRPEPYNELHKDIKLLVDERTYQSILADINHYYPKVISQNIPPTADRDIQTFYEFLKAQESKFQELTEACSKLAHITLDSSNLIHTMCKSLSNVYNIENDKLGTKNASRQTSVLDIFFQWHIDTKNVKDSYFEDLLQCFDYELCNIRSMLDLLAFRESMQNKYLKTKTKSLKWSEIATKCNTDKLRQQREHDMQVEVEEYSILQAITKLILFNEFNKSWRERIKEFKINMVHFAQAQGTYSQRLYQNWSPLASITLQSSSSSTSSSSSSSTTNIIEEKK